MPNTTDKPPDAQAALELAAVSLLRRTLGYGQATCDRMFDGTPPPRQVNFFAAVWGDNSRGTLGQRTNLSEIFGLYVTLTVRVQGAPDRWVQQRDRLAHEAQAILDTLAPDARDYRVIQAANTLAGFRSAGQPGGPPGWVLGLCFGGMDPIQEKMADWIAADPATAEGVQALAQTLKFVGAQRLRSWDSVGTSR